MATRLTPASLRMVSVSGEWTPPISSDRPGWMVKECDVVGHRLGGLAMLVGVLQDLVARDYAALDFIEDDVPPKS